MATLSEMVILWLLFIASQFSIDYIAQQYNDEAKKGSGTKELEQLKLLSTKIQEVTSNVTITEKNEKQYTRDPKGIFCTYGYLLI